MVEFPMRTVMIIVLFIVVAAVALMYIFSTFREVSPTSTYFNFSQTMISNASVEGGKAAAPGKQCMPSGSSCELDVDCCSGKCNIIPTNSGFENKCK